MVINKLVDVIRDTLAEDQTLRGTRVQVAIETMRDDQPLCISLRVPDENAEEPQAEEKAGADPTAVVLENPQTLLHIAMDVVLEQMQLTQDRMEEPDLQISDIAGINRSIVEMARTMAYLSDAQMHWMDGGRRE